MLVLSRKESQWIMIGDTIRVKVVRIGNQVQLGIEAPKYISIRRGELPPKEMENRDDDASVA